MSNFIFNLIQPVTYRSYDLPNKEDCEQFCKTYKYELSAISRDLEKDFHVLVMDYVSKMEELHDTFKIKKPNNINERMEETLYEAVCDEIEQFFAQRRASSSEFPTN